MHSSHNTRDSLFPAVQINYSKPLHILLITIVAIFLTEAVVMFLLPVMQYQPRFQGALINACFLTLIVCPILYFFLLRPLQRQMSDMKKAEEIILEIKQDWEDTFNTITDMVTVHDRDFNIIRANKSAQKLLKLPGLDRAATIKCYTFYHGTEIPMKGCPSCNSIKTGGPCTSEIFEPHLNMFLEIRAIPRLDRNSRITGLIHVVRDITKRKQMEEKLRKLSLVDELTGLYNRRGFFTLIEHHFKLAKRQTRKLLLLYADLDNLKDINDTFGHQEGDRMLTDAAEILKSTYRESDIVARIGGDEFVVFPVGGNKENIEVIKSRLQKNIDTYNMQKDRGYRISISVGISCYDPASPQSVDEILAEADSLMYSCKKNKKGI